MRVILTQLALDPREGLKNFRAIQDIARKAAPRITAGDILLLPELVGGDATSPDYERTIQALALELGCHVVGGSHYPAEAAARVNCGVVASLTGEVIARYEKLNPYGIERLTGVQAGSSVGWFTCCGRHVAILLCADFWFARILDTLPFQPDIVLVSSLSLSEKPRPDHARALWQHMAVARAYEIGAFVGISDWAYPTEYAGSYSSGVAGLAAPNPPLEETHFHSLPSHGAEAFELDFEQLTELRSERQARGFDPSRLTRHPAAQCRVR